MTNLLTILGLVITLATATTGSTRAQGRDEILPPRVDRITAPDENGLQQWVKFEARDCPVCKGTGKTECQRCKDLKDVHACLECNLTHECPCHTCGGTGKLPDPFEKALCPGCNGAGSFPCVTCGCKGTYVLVGSGGRPQKCVACRGDGGFPCEVCGGKRLVDIVRVRGGVEDAKLEDLQAVREKIEETIVAVKDFTGLGTTRKDTKDYGKALAPAARFCPPLKKAAEMIDDLMMKQLARGDRIDGNDELKQAAFQRFRACNLSYLEHQIKVLDLCIARQEANQKVLEEQERAKEDAKKHGE